MLLPRDCSSVLRPFKAKTDARYQCHQALYAVRGATLLPNDYSSKLLSDQVPAISVIKR